MEEYDLSGKTLIPFTTHGGSSLSDTVESIANEQPNTNVVEDGFSISRNEDITAAQDKVEQWLKETGVL